MHGSRMGLTLPYPPEKFKLKSVIKIVPIKLFKIGLEPPPPLPPPFLKKNSASAHFGCKHKSCKT